MGGSDARTLVLVGKTGNGKSATGNTILGKKIFKSKRSLSGVTSTSEMDTTVLEAGQMLTVIDTPGLFDYSVDHETIWKEIVSCIKMAIDGIHAFLLVFSVRSRFSEEEKSAISSLQHLFGEKICDYMIVVLTGADELDEEGKKPLQYFLCECPESLKEILSLCGNRCVLFDNKTNDQNKKDIQVQQLFSCVNMVLDKNGGEPFTNEIFTELQKWKKAAEEQKEEIRVLKETKGCSDQQQLLVLMENKRDEHLTRIFEMVELKLMIMKLTFEQKLSKLDARMKLEEDAKYGRNKTEEEIDRLRKELEEANRKEEEERNKLHQQM